MDKPKFNVYTKVKTNPTPFLNTNQKYFNTNSNGIKKKKVRTSELVSTKNSPILRSKTPLNKVSSTQIYHSNNLPLIGTKSPVSRKLNFQTEGRSKTPIHSENNINIKIKKELQIILALKKQIKAQNEIIAKNTEEITELKKMKNVAYARELKVENEILQLEIEKMKNILDGMNNAASQAIEGIEEIECNTPVEVKQKCIIKSLKEENYKLSTEIFKISQNKNTNDFLIGKVEHYEKKINSLKEINESLTKKLAQKGTLTKSKCRQMETATKLNNFEKMENERSVDITPLVKGLGVANPNTNPIDNHIPIPSLLSNEEKYEIEYLLNQCIKAKKLNWSVISQTIKKQTTFENIENIIIQNFKFPDDDKWIIRRFLIDSSIDKNGSLSLQGLNDRLLEKISSGSDDNGAESNSNSVTGNAILNEIIQKCQDIDLEYQGHISFKSFKEIYNILYNKEGTDATAINEFNLMVKSMKKNDFVPFEKVAYKSLVFYFNSHNNANSNRPYKEESMIEEELICQFQNINNQNNSLINKNNSAYQQFYLNQTELISLLTACLKVNKISFDSFILPIDEQITVKNDMKFIMVNEFTEYLKSKDIVQKHCSITFDKEYLVSTTTGSPQINLTKFGFLFTDNIVDCPNEEEFNTPSTFEKVKTITFKGDPESQSPNKREELNNISPEYQQARAIVTNIFDHVLRYHYINEISKKDSYEDHTNRIIQDIFTKAKESYFKSFTEQTENIPNGVSESNI